MGCDSLDDEEVAINDEEQRQEVAKEAVDQNVRSGEPIFVQVVGTACGHVAFRHVTVKNEKVFCLKNIICVFE